MFNFPQTFDLPRTLYSTSRTPITSITHFLLTLSPLDSTTSHFDPHASGELFGYLEAEEIGARPTREPVPLSRAY